MAMGIEEISNFEALWLIRGEVVKEPNTRGQGFSEMFRLSLPSEKYGLQPGTYFVKRQFAYSYRAFKTLGIRRHTSSREFAALSRFRTLGLDVPDVAYFLYQADSDRSILVTHELAGYCDIKCELAKPLTASDRSNLIHRLSQAFHRLHSSRFRHGALYPDHVFVSKNSVAFIDLEKSRVTMSRRANALTDLARFLRYTSGLLPQEISILLMPYAREFPGFVKQIHWYMWRALSPAHSLHDNKSPAIND